MFVLAKNLQCNGSKKIIQPKLRMNLFAPWNTFSLCFHTISIQSACQISKVIIYSIILQNTDIVLHVSMAFVLYCILVHPFWFSLSTFHLLYSFTFEWQTIEQFPKKKKKTETKLKICFRKTRLEATKNRIFLQFSENVCMWKVFAFLLFVIIFYFVFFCNCTPTVVQQTKIRMNCSATT